MWKTLRSGYRYMELWPRHAVVGNLPESRIAPATKLAWRWLPAAAGVNAFVQYQYLGMEFLPQIIASSLLLLWIPCHGFYWLGKRSESQLSVPLRAWYFELKDKLNKSGQDIRLPSHRQGPCYIDLAWVLRKALAELSPHDF
ncbi:MULTISPECIES: terminus macrodomain insulation protein YfbV [Gammaproteobacteria]|uniref:terminus macrodomain insulation protein YfbV n=1 Tax=Gammaproteobacteria TaxID=1236 RepID=UPI000DCFCB37|nr:MULTISPECIES: terminus macrodomain insulation protein YfbV [Gammaproteobacteria]RTE87044.1 DUF412 family protein [Aliidiomarina sp. B3213]TCZ93166.1 DUF412 family protein [Lysobacter sp. N42]